MTEFPEPTPEELKILQNPDLVNILLREWCKRSVGNIDGKKSLVLVLTQRVVVNKDPASSNAILSGLSGVGKDFEARTGLELCVPAGMWEHYNRISPTALNYLHNSKDEPNFSWDYRVLFLEDVSSAVFNADTLKTIMSGGSHVVITIRGKAHRLKVNGKPVIITTFASVTPSHENLRRTNIIPMDASSEQTQRIKFFQARCEENGESQKYDPIVRSAMCCLKPHTVRVPFAEKIASVFPNDLIVRSSLKRFYDYVKASCVLHQFQREKDDKGSLIANGDDYALAREAFLHCLAGRITPLTHNQRHLLEEIENASAKEGVDFVSVSEFLEQSPIGKSNTYANLDALVTAGILERKIDIGLNNREVMLYRVTKSAPFTLPTFSNLISIEREELRETNRTSSTIKTIGTISGFDGPESIVSNEASQD